MKREMLDFLYCDVTRSWGNMATSKREFAPGMILQNGWSLREESKDKELTSEEKDFLDNIDLYDAFLSIDGKREFIEDDKAWCERLGEIGIIPEDDPVEFKHNKSVHPSARFNLESAILRELAEPHYNDFDVYPCEERIESVDTTYKSTIRCKGHFYEIEADVQIGAYCDNEDEEPTFVWSTVRTRRA